MLQLESIQLGNGAVLDDTEGYRYLLWRTVDTNNKKSITFVMLNPSTADAAKDDPTVRRCKGFARDLGYGQLYIVNLFARRTSSPKWLWHAQKKGLDILGPQNHIYLARYLQADTIVAAWGSHALAQHSYTFPHPLVKLWCLGTTKAGYPRHPLYVPANTPLQPYTVL